MFKKTLMKWRQAKPGQVVIFGRLGVPLLQLRLIALLVIMWALAGHAWAVYTEPAPVDMRQSLGCYFPKGEGELTLAVVIYGKMHCWVIK